MRTWNETAAVTGSWAERNAERRNLLKLSAPGAGHVGPYDRVDVIPWDRIRSFLGEHLA